MADQNAKQRLFNMLDEGAFQPVLRASEKDVPESKRDKLEHVKRATADERDRYQNYGSAEKVYEMFHSDLTSQAAESVNRDLDDLDLPKLADCQKQFDEAARQMGIR